jgi:hypothetical protein
LYRYGTQTLRATVAHGLAVEPEFRPSTVALMAAFYRQKEIDLLLNTTAVPAVGKMAMAFKAQPLPQEDYGTVLFWVLDSRAFTNQVINKLGLDDRLGAIVRELGPLALRGDTVLRRRFPRGQTAKLEVRERKVLEVSEEFLPLWEERVAEKRQVLAFRTPSTLRWHFEIPGSKRTHSVLACHRGSRLVGYLVLSTDNSPPPVFRRSVVADILAAGDDPIVIGRLLVVAYELARNSGSHVLELMGFPKVIRQICAGWRPLSREYPACPFLYRVFDQTLRTELACKDAWYACPYDGDGTLMP